MSERKKITMESSVSELLHSPIGYDVAEKMLLQLGISEKWLSNPIVLKLRLKTIQNFTKKKFEQAFFEAFLHLVNSESDMPFVRKGNVTEKWWKEAVFYQIYPRSFYDTNGDGIGDIRGIIEKLDYLKDLGIDAIWLCPVYDSPDDDNGYDIRDYKKIMAQFGTMEDFDELLTKLHEKDMKIIMDLVVNHTSDEHEWFQKAIEDPTSKYHDYYMFRKGKEVPNNWTSFFSGSAWNYYEKNDEWALHLFSKKQMDLNWENEEVRKEVADMVNWWLDKGVDGFRMDVINYISKEEGLPDGDKVFGEALGTMGLEHYYYGPNLHKYLHELRMATFEPHGAVTVGETPNIGMRMAQLLTAEERKELDLVFSCNHLETPGHVRMDDYQYDLNFYRDYIVNWMENYGDNCWMSLFYNNHDNPRMCSKVNTNPALMESVQILLAVMQLTLKGTPFIFQGDEMGIENYKFTDVSQITDVEVRGYYQEFIDKGMTPEKAFQRVLAGTREHARIPLPWNDTCLPCHEGLTQEISETMQEIYRTLIGLRRQEKALIYGDFKLLNNKKDRFVYERTLGNDSLIIDCNLGVKNQKAYKVPEGYVPVFEAGVADYTLEAYGTIIWKR